VEPVVSVTINPGIEPAKLAAAKVSKTIAVKPEPAEAIAS
jgi:hypothetical protein